MTAFWLTEPAESAAKSYSLRLAVQLSESVHGKSVMRSLWDVQQGSNWRARKLCWRLRKRLPKNFDTSGPASVCRVSHLVSHHLKLQNRDDSNFLCKWSNMFSIMDGTKYQHSNLSWYFLLRLLICWCQISTFFFLIYSNVRHIEKKWHTCPWTYRSHCSFCTLFHLS